MSRRNASTSTAVAGLALAAALSHPCASFGAGAGPAAVTPEVIVTASRKDLIGQAVTASQGSVTREELQLRPAYRIGQLLETIPGLVVTIHSGEAKANQYLARGFNLDHSTDLANFYDDMPINRPTNAHGQGYSDLNFIMPELIDGLDYTKGAYHASVGDFGAVASEHMRMADSIPNQIALQASTLNNDEAFVAATYHIGADDRLLAAADYGHTDGPFTHSDNLQKWAGALRYSHGDGENGYGLMAMYYHGDGNFTTDQPLRAIDEGLIGRFGTLDPSDGAHNERYSLSGRVARSGGAWRLTANLYAIHSRQTLWNDFTHDLEDPVEGDQEQQDETRDTGGGAAALAFDHPLGPFASTTTFGLQARYDDTYIDRRHTHGRHVLDYCEEEPGDGPAVAYSVGERACSEDRVQTLDLGPYVDNQVRWTRWFRTDFGLREEYYRGYDHSLLPGYDGTADFDGAVDQTLFQPKGNFIFGPWWSTEVYVSAGRGFHSDDVRGVTLTAPVQGLPRAAGATPLLVRADSEEVGLRSDLVPKVKVQLAVFNIDLGSELIYDQDEGQDSASAPSRRDGVELSVQHRPLAWLEVNADLTASHARFTGGDLKAYGLGGAHIPNAPGFIGSAGARVDHLGPIYGGLQVRMLGSYPLTDDNRVKDSGYTETNLSLGCHISASVRAELDVFNLFDTRANAAAYDYTDRLAGEPAGGVDDHHVHPLEPTSARFRITATF